MTETPEQTINNQTVKPGTLEGLDLESLRITPDLEGVKVTKILNIVPVRKPHKQEFFRVKEGDEWVFSAWVLEIQEDREVYLISRNLIPTYENELKPVMLFTGYNQYGNYFLIPVPLPKADGKRNRWHESLQLAVEAAKKTWTRAMANMPAGAYDTFTAAGNIREPELFPVSGIVDLIPIAFRDRYINDEDHPVIKRLKGAL